MWNAKIAKICKEVKNAQLAHVLGPIFGHYSSFCILHFFFVFFCIYTLYFCFSADPILMLVLPPCYRWWQTRRPGLKQKSHGQTHRWGPGVAGWGIFWYRDPISDDYFWMWCAHCQKNMFKSFIIWNFKIRNKISGHRVILCGILWWHNWWHQAFLTTSGPVQIFLATSDLKKPYPYFQKYSKTPSLSVEEHKKQRGDTLDQSVSFFFWYLYPFAFFALWLTPFLLVFENSNLDASLKSDRRSASKMNL